MSQPSTSATPKKSKGNQVTFLPHDYKIFMEEAYSSAMCYKLLRDLGNIESSRVRIVTRKIYNMAKTQEDMVLETINKYFLDNVELAAKHRYRLLQILENIITAAPYIDNEWAERFIELALENMTRSTELEDTLQDAASNVLLAMCKHSWSLVYNKLEEDFLTGIFPHRSLLHVMGIITLNGDRLLTPTQRDRWHDQLIQIGAKSAKFLTVDAWAKSLMHAVTRSDRIYMEKNPEKIFVFIYYGMILRATNNSSVIRKHLTLLLDTSHQFMQQREGIAITIGLTAARHLDDAWAVLEQFGRKGPLKHTLGELSMKEEGDLKWKWASSTILLSYGQMAVKAKQNILPWVDNISSRMVFLFRNSCWDDNLKQSFLEATQLLVGAISRNDGAHSYEFTQVTELIDSLLVLMNKEPQDTLCTTTRQQVMCALTGLCKLRPPLNYEKKSKILFTCCQSVYKLPLLEFLERHTCLLADPPNIQVLYMDTMCTLDRLLQSLISENHNPDDLHFMLEEMRTWMIAEKDHERKRAVRSCISILKFVAQKTFLDTTEEFGRYGHAVGMLGILCLDPNKDVQQLVFEAINALHRVLLYQKGLVAPDLFKIVGRYGEVQDDELDPMATQEVVFYPISHVIQEFVKHFSSPQIQDLIWTVIEGLESTLDHKTESAGEMLITVLEDFGAQVEEVSDICQSLYGLLTSTDSMIVKKKVLKSITMLARHHTPELVNCYLEHSLPMDREIINIWRTMGVERTISPKVVQGLLLKLHERPSVNEFTNTNDANLYVDSLAAMNALYEIQYCREYTEAMQFLYPQLLLGLLTQVHYMFELGLTDPPKTNDSSQEAEPMSSPLRTSLDALKSLLQTSGHWKDYRQLELQGAWDLFSGLDTYQQGVTLIARSMVQNSCSQIKGLLHQIISNTEAKPERDKKVANIFFAEFLNSPVMLQELPQQAISSYLCQGLKDPDPFIRVISTQGLKNVIFDPNKDNVIQNQLPRLLGGFHHESELETVVSMNVVSNALHSLSQHNISDLCEDIAFEFRVFFDDHRENVRASAISGFGELVLCMQGKEDHRVMRQQVHLSLVPLLIHLKDHSPIVVKESKLALYRCAVFLKWKFLHTLFSTLAWEESLSARHFLWSYLMQDRDEQFQVYISKTLKYLRSPQEGLKISAALLLGYIISYYPDTIFEGASDSDLALFYYSLEKLKQDPDQIIGDFATIYLNHLDEISKRMK
ncbi:maestro heat-like repeat family member 5 isoform X2 [Notamacropus eugenii]|uniref:maestro heat-like repeat family member 5 isoform X2 n=1 Tax=Notamacropus eugenii TaxID=9315 RepID=UPI003B66CB71